MNKAKTEAAIKFLEKGPTFIGRVLDTDYYEHPEYGDESPLVEVTKDGRVRHSEFWELPAIAELI